MSPDSGFTRGTLVYNKKTLLSLFFWVLWGDFCLQFMGVVVASVLPLLMTQWKAPAIFIGLFVTTIPALLNFLITPLVSVWSDRHRGKWGRRIPFLLIPTPFVVLFLLGIAGTEHVAHLIHRLAGDAWTFDACRMLVLGVMIVAFQIANMIVSSIYYYLFNDVVPEPRMGRFLGLFRIVSIAAAACFHFFVFSHADKHAPAIFAWSALLYGTGFGLMCLNVREGEYPEPESLDARHPAHMAFVLLKECFSTRFFRTYAFFNGAFTFAMAWNAFMQVMQVNVGLSYADIGILMGVASGVSALASYPVGALVDRFRPFAVAIAGMILLAAGQFLYLPLFAVRLPAGSAFWVMGVAVLVTTLGLGVFQGAAMPLHMYVFPKDRYGQFCGALGMLNAVSSMLGGLVAGGLTSAVQGLWGERCAWAFAPIGMLASLTVCLTLLLRSQRLWQARGE
jgi:maltose/moltooligosaccharide transporter